MKTIPFSFFAITTSLFMMFSLCSPTHASMTVYPIEAEVGTKGTAQIRVLSKSDDVQFVNVTVKQISNPGTRDEKEIPVDMTAENALVVAPNKLALSSGSERIVRLVSMVPPPKETTWRVYFESVNEQQQSVPVNAKSSHNGAQVGVSIIWGALVHVAPEKVTTSLKYDSTTGNVINDGTLRMPLKEIGICHSSGQCDWKKETATLYPDTALNLKSIDKSSGKHYRAKYYHWINKSIEEIDIPALQAK